MDREHLQDKNIMTDIRQKFEELCEEYGEAFSENNEDIGRTKLVKMDIDTGDSSPVSSRPYTLPLKHYKWVQREIELQGPSFTARNSVEVLSVVFLIVLNFWGML